MFARACVRVCVCVRATFCVCINVWHLLVQTKEMPEVSFAFEFDPWTSFYKEVSKHGA